MVLTLINAPDDVSLSPLLSSTPSPFVLMCPQGGKFGGSGSEAPEAQGLGYAEDAAEHENMKAVLKSSLQGNDSSASVVPGLRTRTRASRGE